MMKTIIALLMLVSGCGLIIYTFDTIPEKSITKQGWIERVVYKFLSSIFLTPFFDSAIELILGKKHAIVAWFKMTVAIGTYWYAVNIRGYRESWRERD